MSKEAASLSSITTHEFLSSNCDARPEGEVIDTLVIHYTGMQTALGALERMADPITKVSCHYMIHRDGDIYKMVDEQFRAWHAGRSYWRGKSFVNDRSIGIELDNPGHEFGYKPFPEKQMLSLIALSKDILRRQPIKACNVIGHSDVAPDRKEDPGELFDWERLAKEGIGLWPELPPMEVQPLSKIGDKGASILSLQERLLQYGYNVQVTGEFDEHLELVVKAFQRHFGSGSDINGVWNSQLDEMLSALINMSD